MKSSEQQQNKTCHILHTSTGEKILIAIFPKRKPSSLLQRLIYRALSFIPAALLALFPSLVAASPIVAPTQLPTGGQVVAGQAAITQQNAQMNITQSSQSAIVNWGSFNIGSQAAVNFAQPNSASVVLNRVQSADPSYIYGSLTANGQVFLLNQSGILFGQGASVNVGGFVGSTLNIQNSDFLSGNYLFNRTGSTGSIVNQGNLTAANGGYVALLSPNISNQGSITANMGTIALAAGDAVTLDLSGENLLSVTVNPATVQTLIENKQLLQADGGQVILTSRAADTLLGSVINNGGTIEARSMQNVNGQIVLDAGNGTTLVSGKLSATGSHPGETGGTIQVLGNQVALNAGAQLDASGTAGGGTVLVGGDAHGANPLIQNAQQTYVADTASIKADATQNGNGGKVVVWADGTTQFNGNISAQGGTQSGNGGWVETSGKQTLSFAGSVNTTAAQGNTGTLLLDPTDITISTSTNTNTTIGTLSAGTFADNTTTPSNLNTTTLQNALSTSNVLVNTTSSLTGTGNITVQNPVFWSSAYGLTLNATGTGAITTNTGATITNLGSGGVTMQAAGGAITLNGGISLASGPLSLSGTIISNNAAISAGIVNMTSTTDIHVNANVITNNGNINILAGWNPSTSTAGVNPGAVDINGATISSGTGNITITGLGSPTLLDPWQSGENGVLLRGNALVQSTSGNITVTGTGTGTSGYGVDVEGATITSANGNVQVTGTGGAGGGSGCGCGVGIDGKTTTASQISVTGSGGLLVQGTAGASRWSYGVSEGQGGVIQDTGTPATGNTFQIIGTGNAASDISYGVDIGGTGGVSTNNAPLTITGTGGSASLYQADGISLGWTTSVAYLSSTGSGSITLIGHQGSAAGGMLAGISIGGSSYSGDYPGYIQTAGAAVNFITDSYYFRNVTNYGNYVRGPGAVTISPYTSGATLGVGTGATGTLLINSNALAGIDPTSAGLTLGSATTGNVVLGSATFGVPVSILGNNVSVTGSVIGSTLNLNTAGSIVENVGTITASTLNTSSVGGTMLNDANAVGSFTATNTTSGNIVLTDTAATLNITGLSQSGSGAIILTDSGTINVNNSMSWSASKLTLKANNNINFNANLNGSGTASLALQYGQGFVAAGNPSSYNLAPNVQVNLPAGQNFSTLLGSNGSTVNYTVITNLGSAGSTTTTDLQGINGGLAGNYVLGGNIDATATSTWNSGEGFTPIGVNYPNVFTGTFDGLGHTISNLTIKLPSTNTVGLFGYTNTSSVIQNVGIVGDNVQGGNDVGALVATSNGTISSSYATGRVSGISTVGGLVGFANSGMISNCYATGSVTGTNSQNGFVGGLVGLNVGTISNSYASGSVKGVSFDIGGLVGSNYGGGIIRNSYAMGNVSNTGNVVGGLVGINAGAISNSYTTGNVTGTGNAVGELVGVNYTGGTVTNGFWDSSVNATGTGSNSGTITGGGGLTSTQMQTASNFTGFTFTTTPGASGNNWVIVDTNGTLNNASSAAGATFPMLASEYSTTIVNAHQLQLMEMAPAANYTLAANINALTTGNLTDIWAGSTFIPIGNSTVPFTGTFNGQIYTISNLTINLPTITNVGLFGYTGANSVIQNVGLVGDSVIGNVSVGGLVGQSSGTINNSYATGNVSSIGSGSGTINTGGLVGVNGGSINNSYATGSVSGSWCTGGLVGVNAGTISSSYSSASVSGNRDTGGLSGSSGGTISNSYETGSVTFTSGGVNSTLGSLVGTIYGTSSISNSYATGKVSAPGGGLVAYDLSCTNCNISNSFWDSSTVGQNSAAALGTALTTAQMMQLSSFSGWNISQTGGSGDVWRIYQGNTLPLLTSFLTPLTLTGAPDVTLTYNGKAQSGASITLTNGVLGAAATGTNAGFYNGYYSTQQGYDLIGGDLTIRPLTVTVTLAGNKIYNGTTAFSTGQLSISDVISGDTVSLSAGTANTSSKNVGTWAFASFNGLALTGSSAGNYTLTGVSGSGTITPLALTGTIATGSSVYGAIFSPGAVTFTNAISGDNLGTASVAVNKTGNTSTSGNLKVGTYTGIESVSALSGSDAGNYTFAGVTGNYTVSPLALVGTLTAGSSTYGSTLSPGTVTFTNVFAGDNIGSATVSVNTAGHVSSSGNLNAGSYTGIETVSALSGADAGNYTFTAPTGNYTVNPLVLIGSITAGSSIYGSTLSPGTVTFTDAVSGDNLGTATVAVNKTGNTSSSGNLKAGTYTGIESVSALSGVSAGNYTFATVTGNYTVSKLALTGSIANGSSTYGSTLAPGAVSFTNAVSGDVLNAGAVAVSITGNTSSSGNLKAGSYTGIESATGLSGADAANYTFAGATGNYTVTPATITAVTGITAANKTYDGSTTATLTTSAPGFTGMIAGDSLKVSAANGAFSDPNVGTSKTVSVSGLTLGGTDASNYIVSPNTVTTTANITQLASVAWTGSTGGNWSNATNWAGGAIPVGTDVAAVSLPTGSNVTYDAAANSTTLNTLSSAGSLVLTGNNLSVGSLIQSSGSLTGTGKLNVTNSFSQSSGATIALTGAAIANITQASGNLNIVNLSAPTVNLTASTGAITQSGPILATALNTVSATGTTLTDAGNQIGGFSATNSGSGDITLNDTANPLTITGISNTGGGSDTVNNVGAISITGTIAAAGGGSVNLTASGANGAISESGKGLISTTGLVTTSSNGGTSLNDANTMGSFAATNTASGDVSLTNTGIFEVVDISNTPGAVSVSNVGAITVGPLASTANTQQSITAGNSVTLTAYSPLTINGAINAHGNVALTAGTSPGGTTDILTINSPVVSTAGSVSLAAGNNIVGANLVTAALGVTQDYNMNNGSGGITASNQVNTATVQLQATNVITSIAQITGSLAATNTNTTSTSTASLPQQALGTLGSSSDSVAQLATNTSVIATSPSSTTASGTTAPASGSGASSSSQGGTASSAETNTNATGSSTASTAPTGSSSQGGAASGSSGAKPSSSNSAAAAVNVGAMLAQLTAEETARHQARTNLYKDALKVLKDNPSAADVPLCGKGNGGDALCIPEGAKLPIATTTKVDVLAATTHAGPYQPNPPVHKVAVMIGNDNYSGGIQSLDTPVHDVESIGDLLKDKMGYDVSVVRNATKKDVFSALKSVAEKLTAEDSVLIFYAGHGYEIEESKQGFWIPSDASTSDPKTWISNSDIARMLKVIPAKQIILVSDSCFSGTLTQEQEIVAEAAARKDIVLSKRSVVALSSGGEEPVSDAGKEGHSIFAYYFLKEIQGVKGGMSSKQLHSSVEAAVRKDFPQDPQLGGVVSAGHAPGGEYLLMEVGSK